MARLDERERLFREIERVNRPSVNSPMPPNVKRDTDGGITPYVQSESPGAEKGVNWLLAPEGPSFTARRLYWPKPEALNGNWEAPPM